MSETPALPTARRRSLQHPTSAVVALTMGILGLFALPLIGSILAVVFGNQSRREAAAQPEVYTDDLGRIGRILGWIGIGLSVLGLVVVLAAVAMFMPV